MALKWDIEFSDKAPNPDLECIRIQNGRYEGVLFQFKRLGLENKYPFDKEYDELEEGTGNVWLHWGTEVIENPNDADTRLEDWRKTHRAIVSQIGKKLAEVHKPITQQIEKAQEQGLKVIDIDHSSQTIKVLDEKSNEQYMISAETGTRSELIEGTSVEKLESK